MKASHSIKIAALAFFLSASFAAPDADAQRRNNAPPPAMYPDATRKPTPAAYEQRLTRQHKQLQDLAGKEGRENEVIALAEQILAHERAKPYDKAVAAMTAGAAALELDDEPRAIAYYVRAIEEDALPNDNHFSLMINASSLYIGNEQYEEGDALLARLISETSTKNPDVYALQASSFYNNGKYAEAVTSIKKAAELKGEMTGQWTQMLLAAYAELGQDNEAIALGEQILAKSPDDKRAISNLAVLYTNNDQMDKAVALLDGARKRGLMTEAADYERIYSAYYNMEKEAEAAAVLEEGLAKGILPEEAKYYSMVAQAHYFSENIPASIAAAQKAANLAQDGEPGLFLAQVLSQEDRNAEAMAAARAAIAKGVKKPGQAWMVIARSEFYAENLAGARAAYREAAKDPSTADQAQRALAQINR